MKTETLPPISGEEMMKNYVPVASGDEIVGADWCYNYDCGFHHGPSNPDMRVRPEWVGQTCKQAVGLLWSFFYKPANWKDTDGWAVFESQSERACSATGKKIEKVDSDDSGRGADGRFIDDEEALHFVLTNARRSQACRDAIREVYEI